MFPEGAVCSGNFWVAGKFREMGHFFWDTPVRPNAMRVLGKTRNAVVVMPS